MDTRFGSSKQHSIHNARVQLLATMVNNIGVALVVGGLVAPAVTGQLPDTSRTVVTLAVDS